MYQLRVRTTGAHSFMYLSKNLIYTISNEILQHNDNKGLTAGNYKYKNVYQNNFIFNKSSCAMS